MNARPILFSGSMVRALLDGRKTQTRRVAKSPWKSHPIVNLHDEGMQAGMANYSGKFNDPASWGLSGAEDGGDMPLSSWPELCPYGRMGDLLWVRETWCDTNYEGAPAISYEATQDRLDLMECADFVARNGSFNYDDPRLLFGKNKRPLQFAIWCHDLEGGVEKGWKPSIHMPRWASRITLEITGVRVERLQHISEGDALTEGIVRLNQFGFHCPGVEHENKAFPCLSRSNARDMFAALWDTVNGSGAWLNNPWVWVIEFKVHKSNVDDLLRQSEAA